MIYEPDTYWITDAKLVLPERVVNGHLKIAAGLIAEVVEGRQIETSDEEVARLDAGGSYVMPGLIDLHCDAIEKEVEPRPNALFPFDMAVAELEKKLAACGITTMYHSLSMGVGLSLRGTDLTLALMERLARKARSSDALIRHRLHLRYEVTHFPGLAECSRLIDEGKVDYLSIMNHAPGIGQYRKPGAFERYVMKNQGVGLEEVAEIKAGVMARQAQIDWQAIRNLCAQAAKAGIRVASHDDDSPVQVAKSSELGASISEFPITPEASSAAAEAGLGVCVGAPNVVRGGSHDGNLKAIDALTAGEANLVCSDYIPSSLLPALFEMRHAGIPLAEAVSCATLNPAKALGIDNLYGSIAPGKAADLIWVSDSEYPTVWQTAVNGRIVFRSQPAGINP